MISCSNCKSPYPEEEFAYRCSRCGGLFSFTPFPPFSDPLSGPYASGIWRYRSSLGLPDEVLPVTLGEGDTPLVRTETPFGRVHFKLEFLNPSGSHKDRGVAVLASHLRHLGVSEAVEDSSGNAGASLSAYAARAGIRARVFIPAYASGPKASQIESYGAELVRVEGPRSAAQEAVAQAAAAGAVYASHAHLPHLLPGFATLAYELLEQLGQAPGTVIAPAGQGSLLLGIAHGFQNLIQAGRIETMPRLIGVQALACAPLWAMFAHGPAGVQWVTEGETIAEGVRVLRPLWGDPLLQMIAASEGTVMAVDEEAIPPGQDALARLGFYVEPTSAIVWDALRQMHGTGQTPEPVVAILTGSGLKSTYRPVSTF